MEMSILWISTESKKKIKKKLGISWDKWQHNLLKLKEHCKDSIKRQIYSDKYHMLIKEKNLKWLNISQGTKRRKSTD